MLVLARHINGTAVEASDGKVGKLCDLLFDEQSWNVRQLVLDGGTWLNRRRVTLPPQIVQRKDWADHRLLVTGFTRQQVIDSPGTQTHIPVSNAALEDVTVMEWEIYWVDALNHPWQVPGDPRLSSAHEVAGYHIQASDGPIGHVADFVVDDESWTIRFLAVDTRNWWPGKHVLVAPARVEVFDRPNRTLELSIPRDTIQHSPQYRDSIPLEQSREVTSAGPPGGGQ
jgi:hypothetical protein